MIDNFELIKQMFYFNEANNMFFHCQIVERNKDRPLNKVKGTIKTYLIRSKEHLDSVKDEIILLCEHYGARAYINVSGKDFIDVNKYMLLKLSEYNYTGNMRLTNPIKVLNSSVGEVKSRMPRWIIDIDDNSIKDEVYKWLRNLGWYEHQIIEIPTVQGCHFITSKFNLQDFYNQFPNVDVHKNNGTLLYYPKSLS